MALSQQELSTTLKHLKRAPAPKVPVGSSGGPDQVGAINLNAIKLKKTGKRESLIEEDSMASHSGKENSQDELNSVFKNRRAMFEHHDQEESSKKHSSLPRVMPKPKYRRTSSEGSEDENNAQPNRASFPLSGKSSDNNGNIVQGSGIPKMKPLPSLMSVGKIPPPKPTKPLILAMKVQKQYKNHKVIIAPRVQPVAEAIENGRNEGKHSFIFMNQFIIKALHVQCSLIVPFAKLNHVKSNTVTMDYRSE